MIDHNGKRRSALLGEPAKPVRKKPVPLAGCGIVVPQTRTPGTTGCLAWSKHRGHAVRIGQRSHRTSTVSSTAQSFTHRPWHKWQLENWRSGFGRTVPGQLQGHPPWPRHVAASHSTTMPETSRWSRHFSSLLSARRFSSRAFSRSKILFFKAFASTVKA